MRPTRSTRTLAPSADSRCRRNWTAVATPTGTRSRRGCAPDERNGTVFLTSLALLVAAVVLIIVGAIKGSVLLLGISVGCRVAGAIALLVANAVAPPLPTAT